MTRSFELRLRATLFAIAGVTLVVGIFSGLSRLQIDIVGFTSHLAVFHGPVLVSLFFGTVISLERAVAIQTPMAYMAPITNAAAALSLIVLEWDTTAAVLSTVAAFLLTAVSLRLLQKVKADFVIVLAIAAGCWVIGGAVWLLTGDPGRATLLWFSFLVITIAGERLELTRFVPLTTSVRRGFYALLGVIVIGSIGSIFQPEQAAIVFSIGLAGLGGWLIAHDIARRNLRSQGITRYIAICLLSGYGWLVVAGLFGLFGAFPNGHLLRDSAIHTLGLGFVMAMVFGHALIVLPAVAKLRVPYHPMFYAPLILLHGSLLLRIMGRLLDKMSLQQTGGIMNAVTFIVFAVIVIQQIRQGGTAPSASARP